MIAMQLSLSVPMIAAVAAMLAAAALVVALTTEPPKVRRQLVDNLRRGLDHPDDTTPLLGGADRRRSGAASAVRRLTPAGWLTTIEGLLNRAGRPAGWTMDTVLTGKLGAATGIGVLTTLVVLARPQPMLVLVALAATTVGWFLPELLLYSRGTERSEKIARELPDTMDQMVIAVEAGLGFEAAMARTAVNGKGALAEELRRTVQDLQMGSPRRQAYDGLAERAAVADVRRFIRAVHQGEQHGISIADVLRAQAAEQRLKRRQRAEERAMKIPVKVLFPLMVCILPVLFIVLLGPAAISMMGTFG